MASQILLDKPALEILDMLSEDRAMWSEAIRTVHAEALERMRSLLPPGKIFARLRTARATNEYLVRAYGLIRDAVQFEVATNLEFSAYQWIWYLRRLPRPIFQGTLATTYGYDSLLAELISGWAPSASTSPTSLTEGYLTYPVSRPILKEVLRLCAWTLVLSELHTALRWSSKDVDFEFDDAIPTPIADPTDDERAAVSLYDRRVEEGPMSFLGGMATRSAIPSSPLGRTVTESVKDPYLIAVVPIENTEVRIPLVGVRVEQRPKTLAAYSPVPVATAELAALCQSAELKDAAWPQSIPFLLQLLALLGVMFLRQPTWLVNTMQRGYFLATKSVLDRVLEETLPTLSEELLIPTFPNLRFTRTPSDFLLGLRSIRGTDLPLIPGPIVRDAGPERLCLDLWAATARLNKDLQITEPGGSSANLRSRHFEDAVQAVIDESNWKPSNAGRQLRKVLRLKGSDLTDIDAVGESEGGVLLVSCKALFYTPQYDAGEYSAVRNAASTISNAIKNLDRILATPAGDNYDLTGYTAIHTVVCTPQPVYSPIGPATKQELNGLFRACSIDELRRWFESAGKSVVGGKRTRLSRRRRPDR